MSEDEPRQEDPQKKKQAVTFTNLMRAIHSLKLYNELSPREFTFFVGLLCKANEIYPRFPKEFSLTNDEAVDLGAESVRTLQRVRESLANKKIQGTWLLKYKKGNRWTERCAKYQINYAFLLSCISTDSSASHGLGDKNVVKIKNNETSKLPDNSILQDLDDKNVVRSENLDDKNVHILRDLDPEFKRDLSPDNIVTGFYKGIGQERIPKSKRERAKKDIEELLEEFTLEDIQFAVEWTIKNVKEKPYSFALVKDTIGQAINAKEQLDRGKARRDQEELAAAQERAKRERENEEKARMENYKKSLGTEERAKLHERALAEIRESDKIKDSFINEPLIEAKENKLIRSQPDWKREQKCQTEAGAVVTAIL